MRTVYFVEPGQRLNDIKPSKRNRALLLTKQEWQHFGNYMVKKQKELEAIETAVVEKENRKPVSYTHLDVYKRQLSHSMSV